MIFILLILCAGFLSGVVVAVVEGNPYWLIISVICFGTLCYEPKALEV